MQTFTDVKPNTSTTIAPANTNREVAVIINYGPNTLYLGGTVGSGTQVAPNGGSALVTATTAILAAQGGPGTQQVSVIDADTPANQVVAGNPITPPADSGGGGGGAPNAHHTSHQNGGSDEIATATPAANAIPKADGSGKLDAWVTDSSVPDASTSVKGIVQLATDGEEAESKAVQSNDARLAASGTVKTVAVLWSPDDVTQDQADTAALVVPAPCLLVGAYWERVTPTDAGSTPTLAIADDQGRFDSGAIALKADNLGLFLTTNAKANFLLLAQTPKFQYDAYSASIYLPLSFTFTYVAGLTPGATTPIFKLSVAYVPGGGSTSPNTSPTLVSELADTAVVDPQVGDALVWNGTRWVNAALAAILLRRTVSLTVEDIRALATTPFELVPAPAAGKFINVLHLILTYHAGSHPYPNENTRLFCAYNGVQDNFYNFAIALLSLSDDAVAYFSPDLTSGRTDIVAAALQLVSTLALDGIGIASATVHTPGSGNFVDDGGHVNAGDNNAFIQIKTIDGDGGVLTFSVTPGSGYSVANDVGTSMNNGDGLFTIDITEVAQGDGTLDVTTIYTIEDA